MNSVRLHSWRQYLRLSRMLLWKSMRMKSRTRKSTEKKDLLL